MTPTTHAPSGELEIRGCRPADYATIAGIYNVWIRAGGATMDTILKTESSIAEWIGSLTEREEVLVAERDGSIAGWGVIKRYGDRLGYRVCAETSVFLAEGTQRQGVGSALKRALIERARALGYHHLLARIWADNEASIAYNCKLGYEVVGVQREIGHCQGEWRDVCVLQLILDDVPPFRPEQGWPTSAEQK